MENCIPEVGCELGCPDLADCSNFQDSKQAEEAPGEVASDTIRMPWTGRTMGARDIAFVAAANYPTIVSVIGPHDAGKTTLLAGIFLAISKGLDPSVSAKFAGSYSLSGWQDVSARMRLDANGDAQFPLHTPDSSNRIPGLLHLRYRLEALVTELLFADAPGEWFTRWAKDRRSEGAQGAEWITQNARKHVVVADSRALSGDGGGLAREQFERIVGRLAGIETVDEVALVWTKSDVHVPKSMVDRVEETFKRYFADGPIYRTQIPLLGTELASDDPQSLRAILDWLLAPATRKKLRVPSREPSEDPFFMLGVKP